MKELREITANHPWLVNTNHYNSWRFFDDII